MPPIIDEIAQKNNKDGTAWAFPASPAMPNLFWHLSASHNKRHKADSPRNLVRGDTQQQKTPASTCLWAGLFAIYITHGIFILKNLLKLKHKSFSDYRLLGCWKGDTIMLMLLAEQRKSVYKHKDDLAKYAGRL